MEALEDRLVPTVPTLMTFPNTGASTTLGTSSILMVDTAVIANETDVPGLLYMELINPNGVRVHNFAEQVSANGTYTDTFGYQLPTNGTKVTGTYQWNAAYEGNSGTTISDYNDPSEQTAILAASPTISTTPSTINLTLGTSSSNLKDTAVISGGYFPSGSITFTLIGPNGAQVDSETVLVNGNNTYTTPSGYTLPTSGSVAGTYQWNAVYTGDNNNNGVSEASSAAERVTVSRAIATLAATASPGSATLGTSSVSLSDQAAVSGYFPSGNITFQLRDSGGTVLSTQTVTVSGNATYSTPSSYLLPTSGAVAGSYTWTATYSGDGNNSTTSNSSSSQMSSISPASPVLATTAQPQSAAFASPAPTLKDSAALSDGYFPQGSITFTLTGPGNNTLDTETVTVDGNNTYSTPSGYTLPSSGGLAGTYHWSASYSGDLNNNSAIGNPNPQPVSVTAASPTLVTTPSRSTVTLGVTAPTLIDTALLSSAYGPTGTITFNLRNPLGSIIYTETVSVTGNGSYSTPAGYTLLTSGSQTGTYQWQVSYSGDGQNSSASDSSTNEQVAVSAASPTLNSTPGSSSISLASTAPALADTASLQGGYFESGSITFTLYNPSGAAIYSETVSVNGNGTYATTAGYTLPTAGTVTGTYQWAAVYDGDANNQSASDSSTSERVAVSAASPILSTTPGSASFPLATTAPTLSDSANLQGGYFESGSITFTLYNPSGTSVHSETVSVNGNGTYATTAGYTLPSSGTAVGTYQWTAVYNGDANNHSASDSSTSERVAVSAASPILSTAPNSTSIVLGGSPQTLKDTGSLSPQYYATGSITFTLHNPAGSLVDTETVTVNGSGSYTTPSGYTISTSNGMQGTYQWDAVYSGDANNHSYSEQNDPSEQVSVLAVPTLGAPSFTSVTTTSAILAGSIVSGGGASLIKRGFVYSLTANPVLGGAGVFEVDVPGTSTGAFSALISGLSKTTRYYFAAFAVNNVGLGYSPVSLFYTAPATFVTGPTTSQVNQSASFTFFASDPSPQQPSSLFVFHINWGDGSGKVLTVPSGTSYSHIYTTPGTYTVQVAATDNVGTILPLGTWTITISSARPAAFTSPGIGAILVSNISSTPKAATSTPTSTSPLLNVQTTTANGSIANSAQPSSPAPTQAAASAPAAIVNLAKIVDALFGDAIRAWNNDPLL